MDSGQAPRRIGELLMERRLITQRQLDEALSQQRASKEFIGEILVRLGFVKPEALLAVLSERYNIPHEPLTVDRVDWELVKQFPADSVGLSNLAVAHMLHRDMERALEVGRKASAIYPMNVLRKNNVALFAMYSGKFEEAEKQAAAVLEMNKEFPKAYVAMGVSQLALGRPPDATATFKRAEGVSAAARDFASHGLADQALYEGRLADAAAILEKAIATPGAPASVARFKATLAEVRVRQGRNAEALKLVDESLKDTPDLAVRFFAGRVAIEAGKPAEALIASLGQAIDNESRMHGKLLEGEALLHPTTQSPRGGDPGLARGNAREALARFGEAQQFLDSWLGRFGLGRAYLELGAFVEAQGEFERCLKRQGEATTLMVDDIATYRFLAPVHYYLGRAQEGVKSPAAAASFKTFLDIKQRGDEAGGLVADARRRLTAQ